MASHLVSANSPEQNMDMYLNVDYSIMLKTIHYYKDIYLNDIYKKKKDIVYSLLKTK